MTFKELNFHSDIQEGLDAMYFEKPTPVQELAIPVIMEGRDIIACAQTGTGKTIAYLLPLIQDLKYTEQPHPRVIILVPTRELVIQIVNESNHSSALFVSPGGSFPSQNQEHFTKNSQLS